MKKLFLILLGAGIIGFTACGPSAKEKAEKARQDSINVADSIAQVEMRIQDSIKAAEEMAKQQAIQDSIAKAEEEAAAKKGKKK